MSTFNVADFETFIRGYMIYNIKQAIPELDISTNSGFDDLFVKPMLEIIPPLVDTINSLEFRMNLDNAQYMSESDLDSIGNGNYLIVRGQGTKATTSLTLSFLKIDTSKNLIIPVGATFATEAGLKFQTTQKYEYTPTELLTKYNSSKTTYDLDVPVEAMAVGTNYNVSENQITVVVTKISTTLASITNKAAVTSGTDKETNIDYASRIREYYISRHLGTKPGYKQYIYSNFSEVEDIYIAGFGDDEMERDFLTVLKDGVLVPMHMGGKADLYIKGCIYQTNTTSLTLNTLKLKLQQAYSKVSTVTIAVDNLTDNTKIPEFVVTEGDSDTCIVTLTNDTEQSFDPDLVSSIQVTYTYDSGGAISTAEIFSVGLSQLSLNSPFKSIVSIYETANESNNYTDVLYYDIIRSLIDGTVIDSLSPYYESSQEYAAIKMKNLESIINGTALTINYTTNSTIQNLTTDFDLSENRIITTDLLFKEAPPVFINIGFTVKLRIGMSLDDTKVAVINSALTAYFDTLGLGSRVEESDVVGWLYKTGAVTDFLEYIMLPFTSFYVPTNASDDIIVQRDGTYISVTNLQYPSLNKTSIAVTS